MVGLLEGDEGGRREERGKGGEGGGGKEKVAGEGRVEGKERQRAGKGRGVGGRRVECLDATLTDDLLSPQEYNF